MFLPHFFLRRIITASIFFEIDFGRVFLIVGSEERKRIVFKKKPTATTVLSKKTRRGSEHNADCFYTAAPDFGLKRKCAKIIILFSKNQTKIHSEKKTRTRKKSERGCSTASKPPLFLPLFIQRSVVPSGSLQKGIQDALDPRTNKTYIFLSIVSKAKLTKLNSGLKNRGD